MWSRGPLIDILVQQSYGCFQEAMEVFLWLLKDNVIARDEMLCVLNVLAAHASKWSTAYVWIDVFFHH